MEILTSIISHFPEAGEVKKISPLTSGLINKTYLVQTLDDSASDYILQCINHQVFTDVDMLQHNMEVITAHIRKKLEEKQTKDIDRKVLRFLKSDTGKTYYFDGERYWRVCVFIPESQTLEAVTPESSYLVGVKFGEFEAMLADLAERERQCRKPSTRQPAVPQPTAQQSASAVSAASATSISSDNATESKLVAWQRRLAESSWAKRIPAWTERAIVVDVPGVGLVNGKLDAVFIGGLDPSSTTARFTVVDWKTGRRPTKPDDITRKLAQLDMYRLLLAAVEGVELDSIDATLYYVSEPDEGLRELHARAKTKQEILTELSSGIPEQSDND